MEHQNVSIFKTEHESEIEMPKASEEVDILPLTHQSQCNPICPFSNPTNAISESERRSKSVAKLCGLITFYLILMAVEVVGGVKANSLAVLTDAAHLLTDVAAVFISLFSVWASGWEATGTHSFGFFRLEVLGALLSMQLIWLISGVLFYEALARLLVKKARVNGELMFAIATFGFIMNVIMVTWMGHDHSHHHDKNPDHDHDHNHDDHGEVEVSAITEEERASLVLNTPIEHKTVNLNLQGAYLHIISDIFQSAGVMIAGGIIWAKPDWLVADLICTLAFSIMVISTTLPMLRNVIGLLMERTPRDIDVANLMKGMKCVKGVDDIHDLHVWALTEGKVVLSCHVVVDHGVSSSEIVHKIRDYCENTYKIHHVTIQIEEK